MQTPLSDESIKLARQPNHTVDNIETDITGEYTVVDVTGSTTNTESGDTHSLNLCIQVRRDGGDWKMFNIHE